MRLLTPAVRCSLALDLTTIRAHMIKYDMSRARQAVQYLVDSSYFHHHVTKLRTTILKPRALPFRGDAEVLNELVLIGRQNPSAMENLIEVAEFKRGGRNEYQREYMAAKRKRDKLVLELEELMTGRRITNHDERTAILQRQYKVWNKERDAMLASLGDVRWLEKNEYIKAFWERKEAEIVALMHEASERKGPVKRRRTVVVQQEPKSEFGKALAAVVRAPPKRVDKHH